MKKYITIFTLCLVLSSCSNNDNNSINPASQVEISSQTDTHYEFKTGVVSNLNSSEEQKSLRNIMASAGIETGRIDRFFDQVNFFNENIPADLLNHPGKNDIGEYDVYKMQDIMFEKFPEFPGTNCRITTFGLSSDKITIGGTRNPDTSIVAIDHASFENPPVATLSKEEIKIFDKFYSPIPIENDTDINKHTKAIDQFYAENNISFPTSDEYKIISAFVPSNLDEDKNELFVGHTGILFDLEDGKLLFVEKLAFTAPYQAIAFNDRTSLYNYLMKMYDTSNEFYPIKPIIYENDKLLVN